MLRKKIRDRAIVNCGWNQKLLDKLAYNRTPESFLEKLSEGLQDSFSGLPDHVKYMGFDIIPSSEELSKKPITTDLSLNATQPIRLNFRVYEGGTFTPIHRVIYVPIPGAKLYLAGTHYRIKLAMTDPVISPDETVVFVSTGNDKFHIHKAQKSLLCNGKYAMGFAYYATIHRAAPAKSRVYTILYPLAVLGFEDTLKRYNASGMLVFSNTPIPQGYDCWELPTHPERWLLTKPLSKAGYTRGIESLAAGLLEASKVINHIAPHVQDTYVEGHHPNFAQWLGWFIYPNESEIRHKSAISFHLNTVIAGYLTATALREIRERYPAYAGEIKNFIDLLIFVLQNYTEILSGRVEGNFNPRATTLPTLVNVFAHTASTVCNRINQSQSRNPVPPGQVSKLLLAGLRSGLVFDIIGNPHVSPETAVFSFFTHGGGVAHRPSKMVPLSSTITREMIRVKESEQSPMGALNPCQAIDENGNLISDQVTQELVKLARTIR